MKVADKPIDEADRLKALYEYQILDTDAEAIFDTITQIATKVCQTPIGLITLIDQNRQWFKANIGLEGSNNVPRELAFCSHTILEPKLLEVIDAEKDDRFHDNPFVLGDPKIRFYAGMPLVTPNGYKLGALCVIDKLPKHLNEIQKSILKDLSSIVIQLFENRKAILNQFQQLTETELHLRDHQKFTDQILDNSIQAILTFNKYKQIESINPAATKLFRYTADELLQKKIDDLLPELKMKTNRHHVFETIAITKQKKQLEVEVSLSKLDFRDKNGAMVAFIKDITKIKQVNAMKNEFISIASHELKTPLTSIQGALSLIRTLPFLQQDHKSYNLIQIAHNNCQRLSRLITDMLDIEKIEAGKLKLDCKNEEICGIIDEVIQNNHTFAQKYNVGLKFVRPSKDIILCTDRDRLTQILTNLISNAVKFSPSGATVDVKVFEKNGLVLMSVQDHGCGMTEEFQAHLFEKFSQEHQANTRSRGGTGLGLAITKSLVEALKGKISFESKCGAGTTFTISFPLH